MSDKKHNKNNKANKNNKNQKNQKTADKFSVQNANVGQQSKGKHNSSPIRLRDAEGNWTTYELWKKNIKSKHQNNFKRKRKRKGRGKRARLRRWQKKYHKSFIKSFRSKRYYILRKFLKPSRFFPLSRYLKNKPAFYRSKFRLYHKTFGKYYGKSFRSPRVKIVFGFLKHNYLKERLRQKKRIYLSYKGVPNNFFGVKYKGNISIKEYPIFKWRLSPSSLDLYSRGYRFNLKKLLRRSSINNFKKFKTKKFKSKFNFKGRPKRFRNVKLPLRYFKKRGRKRIFRLFAKKLKRKTFFLIKERYRFFRSIYKIKPRIYRPRFFLRFFQYKYFRKYRKIASLKGLTRSLFLKKRYHEENTEKIGSYFLKRGRRSFREFKLKKIFWRLSRKRRLIRLIKRRKSKFHSRRKIRRFNRKKSKYIRKNIRYIRKARKRLFFSFRKAFDRVFKFKRLDAFLIKVRSKKIIKRKILHRRKVKLDRTFRMTYNKPHYRKKAVLNNRWDFVLNKAFNNFYDLRYSLFTMFYGRSISEINQHINFGRFSINDHSPKNETYLSKGDLVSDLYNNNDFDLEINMEEIKTRRMFYPFIEVDDYVQSMIVVKDVELLSRSDTFLMNIATVRFANINFLRR